MFSGAYRFDGLRESAVHNRGVVQPDGHLCLCTGMRSGADAVQHHQKLESNIYDACLLEPACCIHLCLWTGERQVIMLFSIIQRY